MSRPTSSKPRWFSAFTYSGMILFLFCSVLLSVAMVRVFPWFLELVSY